MPRLITRGALPLPSRAPHSLHRHCTFCQWARRRIGKDCTLLRGFVCSLWLPNKNWCGFGRACSTDECTKKTRSVCTFDTHVYKKIHKNDNIKMNLGETEVVIFRWTAMAHQIVSLNLRLSCGKWWRGSKPSDMWRWVVPGDRKDRTASIFRAKQQSKNTLDHEDEGTAILRNIGNCSPDGTASHRRRLERSGTPLLHDSGICMHLGHFLKN